MAYLFDELGSEALELPDIAFVEREEEVFEPCVGGVVERIENWVNELKR